MPMSSIPVWFPSAIFLMFSFNERLGMYMTVEGACLSIAAVISILCFLVYKWIRRTVLTWGRSDLNPDASDSSLFLSLMLADLIQAIGNLPSIVWMEHGEVAEGSLCRAQAVIKQVGIVGVAMSSLSIAVHTFLVLILRWRVPRHTSKLVVIGIWIFVAFVIGIPHTVHTTNYYGPIGYWCWIVEGHRTEQIVTEYLWVWIAAFTLILLYGIMFIVMRGWLIVDDNGIHWYLNYESPHPRLKDLDEEEKRSKAIANLLLFYPAVYIISVLPNSISRWLFFSGHDIPYQFTLFANTLFSLSGLLNVILFFSTRPELVKGPSREFDGETGDRFRKHDRKESQLGQLPDVGHGSDDQRWSGYGRTDANTGRLPDRNE